MLRAMAGSWSPERQWALLEGLRRQRPADSELWILARSVGSLGRSLLLCLRLGGSVGFRRRRAITAREVWTLAGIGAASLIIASTLIGVDILLSRSFPGGGSILAAWAGARAVIWQQASPYSGAVASLTQQLTYGRPAAPGENPYFLTTPLHLLLLYFPFALTANPTVARGLWMALSQAALVATGFLTLHLLEWRPPRAFTIAYSLLAGFGVYSVIAWLDGSPAPMLGLLYLGVILTYAAERDELAGALLALCLFDWKVGAPFVLLILLRVCEERRWNVLAGTAMVLIVLGAISFLASPGWIIPFLTVTVADIRASFGTSTSAGLEFFFPHQGVSAAQALTVIIAALLVFEWATSRGAGLRRFIWTLCFALAATPLLGFRTELGNLAVILPGVGLVCATAMRRGRYGTFVAGAFMALVSILPWYAVGRWFLTGDQVSHDLLLLIYPFLTILGLYWTRWWFVRPQQPWLDQIRSEKAS